MIAVREYRLPRVFYADHVARDLPAGRVVRELARQVVVELDAEDFAELRSDASYYTDPATAAEMGLPGLASSARATVRALDRQGAPPPLPADEVERRAAERAARDAADRERSAAYHAEREAERRERAAAEAERREREDALPGRLLVSIENSGRERDGITPADATRILDERRARWSA